MRHANGFTYFRTVPFIGDGEGYNSLRAVQSARWDKAERRDPRLTEMEQKPIRGNSFSTRFAVYLGGDTAWDRKHRPLVDATWDRLAASTPAVRNRMARFMVHAEEANRAYLAALTPEQARDAFASYHATGLNGKSWEPLKWYEVLPPGITPQMAADATGQAFFYDHGWQYNERGQSVKRHTTFAPDAKPRKGFMVAGRI